VIWLVDISRLVENLHLRTPTGIDRVEMAYVQHFLGRAGREDVRFVVTWPYLTGILSNDYVRPVIEAAASRWSADGQDAARDSTFVELRDVLCRPPAESNGRSALRVGGSDARAGAGDWVRTAAIGAQSAGNRLSRRHLAAFRAEGACYVHVSQFRLNRPRRFSWLSAAAVRGVFFLHDLIPITHPEYCRPGEAGRHARRVDTMARHASVIIANSGFTRSSFEAHRAATGGTAPPCEVVPLGLSGLFLAPSAIAPIRTETPYFVVVGTIEPRKNLAFLLQVWHRWTRAGASRRARLVVVGRRGWENENVLDLLERSIGLAPTVIEVATLSDAGMVALLRGATALLAPSLVEGFGLPIAEALALGVPVIASDIEAHREVGGAFAQYVGPADGLGWMAALDDCIRPESERRPGRQAGRENYKPTSWSDHMARVEDIVARIGTS